MFLLIRPVLSHVPFKTCFPHPFSFLHTYILPYNPTYCKKNHNFLLSVAYTENPPFWPPYSKKFRAPLEIPKEIKMSDKNLITCFSALRSPFGRSRVIPAKPVLSAVEGAGIQCLSLRGLSCRPWQSQIDILYSAFVILNSLIFPLKIIAKYGNLLIAIEISP